MHTIYIRKLRYEEARQKFLQEIEHAFYQGISEVEIIHGVGTYTLRNMLLKEIKRIDYISISNEWNSNPGSLKVLLAVPDAGLMKKYID